MLIAVAVPVPGLGPLTYRVPAGFGPVARGMRVLVPLGNRTVTGCVLAAPAAAAPGLESDHDSDHESNIKAIEEVLDREVFLPDEVIDLALWVAEYYAAGPGEALATAMPPLAGIESRRRVSLTDAGRASLESDAAATGRTAVLRALAASEPLTYGALARAVAVAGSSSTARRRGGLRQLASQVARLASDGLVSVIQPLEGKAAAFRTERLVMLTAQGHERFDDDATSGDERGAPRPRLGARQREALDLLRGVAGGISASDLRQKGVSSDTVKRLLSHGLVAVTRRRVDRDPFITAAGLPVAGDEGGEPELLLTDEQAVAVEALVGMSDECQFHVTALHGVTGSGKTEVYVRVAHAVLLKDRTVLILVPEIALTPAVASRFRRAFGDQVAIQHSGLSSGERHDQWHRIRRGEVSVVVGTRSAVFAPLASLGLIIVDEEHDTSYKQDESPRYHGRDVAVVRGRRAGALVVLGSATPSLETYQNTIDGRYRRITLARRVLDRPLAAVELIDMRLEYAEHGPDVVVSHALFEHMRDRLRRGEQTMLLLNRRGFSTSVFCRQCGETLECPNCSVSLTVHRAAHRARCHYCNHSVRVPAQCPACGGPFLEHIGFGTERVEAIVRAHIPDARVARLDRDTVRRRGAVAEILGRFARQEIDVLVGTQMVAKGHDFPAVTLVGVISADVGLGLADFRAAERTFQLLTQVAGRAGRGERPGLAVVQTLYPEHYSIRHACRQDYTSFFAEESQFRRAMRYPPAIALVNTVVRARSLGASLEDAASLVRRLRQSDEFRVLGPAPAPFGKLRGEHRAQFFLKGRHRGIMRRSLLAALDECPELRRRVTIDVDPLSVL